MKTNKKFYYNLIIVALAIIGVFFAGHVQKLYISAVFISTAFIASFFFYKKTFPFIIIGLGFFWYAIMVDIWNGYDFYNPDGTRFSWTVGNVLISIGLILLLLEEYFPKQYKKIFTGETDKNTDH
ncbi:hypothetical protein [Chryseobacterium sp.]|uniref:hypothetical protein n=1 Tax=Chryseobacterium sp. TaxID=1871047 RepID=UPI0031D6C95A